MSVSFCCCCCFCDLFSNASTLLYLLISVFVCEAHRNQWKIPQKAPTLSPPDISDKSKHRTFGRGRERETAERDKNIHSKKTDNSPVTRNDHISYFQSAQTSTWHTTCFIYFLKKHPDDKKKMLLPYYLACSDVAAWNQMSEWVRNLDPCLFFFFFLNQALMSLFRTSISARELYFSPTPDAVLYK